MTRITMTWSKLASSCCWKRSGQSSSPNRAVQVCDAMCSRDVRALDGTKTAICAVRSALQKFTFGMPCIFTAFCALIEDIHCDVGHDASIIAIAMPRCGELRSCLLEWTLRSPIASDSLVPFGRTSTCGTKVLFSMQRTLTYLFVQTI